MAIPAVLDEDRSTQAALYQLGNFFGNPHIHLFRKTELLVKGILMVEEDAHYGAHVAKIIESPADHAFLHAFNLSGAKQPENVGDGITFLFADMEPVGKRHR